METTITDLEDVEDSIEGAVIESLESGVNGLHIVLVDGRVLVFPDAGVVAIYRPHRTLQ